MSKSATVTDDAARRAAIRVGLRAIKSGWRRDTIDNRGGFQLLDGNIVVDGEKFDLSAARVVELCKAGEFTR